MVHSRLILDVILATSTMWSSPATRLSVLLNCVVVAVHACVAWRAKNGEDDDGPRGQRARCGQSRFVESAEHPPNNQNSLVQYSPVLCVCAHMCFRARMPEQGWNAQRQPRARVPRRFFLKSGYGGPMGYQ